MKKKAPAKHEDAKQDRAMIKKEIGKYAKKDKKDDMKMIRKCMQEK